MELQIIHKEFSLSLYGFSGTAINCNWPETGFRLMNKMWGQVKSNNLAHKGINVWVYDENSQMFAGVELDKAPPDNTGLEFKSIHFVKYAYYKHIGTYAQIKDRCDKVQTELKSRGVAPCLPYIEIYGHWTNDETKLETELIWCLI